MVLFYWLISERWVKEYQRQILHGLIPNSHIQLVEGKLSRSILKLKRLVYLNFFNLKSLGFCHQNYPKGFFLLLNLILWNFNFQLFGVDPSLKYEISAPMSWCTCDHCDKHNQPSDLKIKEWKLVKSWNYLVLKLFYSKILTWRSKASPQDGWIVTLTSLSTGLSEKTFSIRKY